MSNAGKKLQDIYDAGSTKLKELEQAQSDSFQGAADAHLETSGTTQKASVDRAKRRSGDLQSEVEAGVSKSAARIQKAIESETEATKRYLEELLHKVGRLATQLEQSMNELSASRHADLEHLRNDARHHLEREVEDKSVELQKHSHEASRNLQSQNTYAINSFQQRLDNGLLEVRGEDQVLRGKLFDALLQNGNAVDTHINACLQQLSLEYKTSSDALAAKFQQSQDRLQAHIENLATVADQQTLQANKQLNEKHESLTQACDFALSVGIDDSTGKVKAAGQTSTGEINSAADGLKSELQRTGQATQDVVSTKSNDAHKHVEEKMSAYTAACNQRLEGSLQLQQALEQANTSISSNIKQSIFDLQDTYSKNLGSVTAKITEEMTVNSNEALDAIYKARQDADKQIQSLTSAAKKQITSAITDFINRVEQRKAAALEEIQQGATGSAPIAEPPPRRASTPAAKKSRKKKTVEPESSESSESKMDNSGEEQ